MENETGLGSDSVDSEMDHVENEAKLFLIETLTRLSALVEQIIEHNSKYISTKDD